MLGAQGKLQPFVTGWTNYIGLEYLAEMRFPKIQQLPISLPDRKVSKFLTRPARQTRLQDSNQAVQEVLALALLPDSQDVSV